MTSDWKRFTFRELIELGQLEVGDGYRAKNEELGGNGLIFLRAGHVTDTFIDFTGVEHFKTRERRMFGNKISCAGDVVITTKGNSTGRVSYVNHSMPEFVYSPHLSYWRSLDKTAISPGYLRYWSRSAEFQTQLAAMAFSTDMAPYLSLRDQHRLSISIPPLPEQRAIADILGSLDDKIELNRQMNATLEATARALFQSWFVDFDPVHAKAAGEQPYGMDADTAALFPAAFEDSELGMIPQGWGVGTLGDVATNPRRSIQPEQLTGETPYIGLQNMPQKSIALAEWGSGADVESNKYVFNEGEVLFGKLRPYFHKVGVAPIDGVCSTDILVVTPKKEMYYSFVLETVSSDELIAYTTATSGGTRMPRTSWHDLAAYPVVLPPEPLVECFNDLTRPVVAAIMSNVFEARTLSQLRDALLPRLVSGQVRVEGIGG